jgi:hypothetical protein
VTEETMGIDSQAACLVDGPIDDYESWREELPEEPYKDKTMLYVHGLRISQGGRCLTSYLDSTRLKPLLLKTME